MALIRPIPNDASNIKYVLLGLGSSTSGNVTIPKGRYKILAFTKHNYAGYMSGIYYFHIKIGTTASDSVVGIAGSNLTIISTGTDITNSNDLNDFNSVAPVIEMSADGNVTFTSGVSESYHTVMVILIPDN